MPRLPGPLSGGDDDREYNTLLRQIRFNEYAAACARSGQLKIISSELLQTAEALVRSSEALRSMGGRRRI